MELEELLEQCQRANIVLIPSARRRVSPWCPGRRISRPVRAAIRANARELLRLITESRVDVCPARDLHRQYWRYDGAGRFTCGVCERLGPYVHMCA